MTIVMNELVTRLKGVAQTAKGSYAALCPAHDDRVRSLEVGVSEGGKVLVHCHGGCSDRAVLHALGFTPDDLTGEPLLTFGRYKGQPIRACDSKYLVWLLGKHVAIEKHRAFVFDVAMELASRFDPWRRHDTPPGGGG